jgi:homospermidine synthase
VVEVQRTVLPVQMATVVLVVTVVLAAMVWLAQLV